jgi:hypothetical protein
MKILLKIRRYSVYGLLRFKQKIVCKQKKLRMNILAKTFKHKAVNISTRRNLFNFFSVYRFDLFCFA